MRIIVRGHGTRVTAAMRDYAQKKVGKFEQFFGNIQKAEVTLDARSLDDSKRSQVAEVTIWAAGKKVIRASEAGQDMYAAIDLVCEEADIQLRKHKDKLVKEKRRKGGLVKGLAKTVASARSSGARGGIVSVNKFASKPMFPEEAIEEIKTLKQDFLLFLNPESKTINLACRKGKDITVLEPGETEMSPISPYEAADKMEETGHSFLMFKNRDTNDVNVIYKRRTGSFGLIEPRA